MARPVSKTPSEAELEVLQVIWRRGPSTLRQVHESLPQDLTRASVFNRLETLVEKGLLTHQPRSKGEGATYAAKLSRESVLGRIVRRLASILSGSPASLIQGLIRSGELDTREVRQLRALLRRQNERGKGRAGGGGSDAGKAKDKG